MRLLTTITFLLACGLSMAQSGKSVGSCEDCELMFADMPAQPSWSTRLGSASTPGEPLVIRGTIYQRDGKTPAPHVILYVYHTNHNGTYTPGDNQKNARRHGALRGWVKTDQNGRYEFTTIRPAAYPGRTDPAHIHPIIMEPDGRYYWIDDYLFDDDKLVTTRVRNGQQKRGGSGIITVRKNTHGVWEGRRDIILGMNVY